MNSRRRFLKQAGLVSISPIIPGFLSQTLAANDDQDDNGKILVVIQLDGGNDGLNTIVPFADDRYRNLRSTIAVPTNSVLKIDESVGFNPAMGAAAEMLQQQQLAVVQGVGYPNPDRSHFRSMAIWQTASNRDELPENGWIGRALDDRSSGRTDTLFVGDEDMPLTLRGRRTISTSLSPGKSLTLKTKINPKGVIGTSNPGGKLHSFVQRNVLDAYKTIDELNRPGKKSTIVYPASGLGRRLETIARFIGLNMKARVYYAIQSGYDTHESQLSSHNVLLSDFSTAMKAFMDEMKAMGLQDRVLLMAFSEFGRRVSENGSGGTDHGTAGPVFLAGSKVRSGLIGSAPNLADLDGDDLKTQYDFRRVYASLLEDWLQIPATPVLGHQFEKLPIL